MSGKTVKYQTKFIALEKTSVNERGAESFDGASVDFVGGGKIREIMDEASVDDPIGGNRPALQAVGVFHIAPMHSGPGGCQYLGGHFGAGEAEYLMARFE